MRLRGSVLRRLARLLKGEAFRLQSQMDIHPRSLWHNPHFLRETGGFYPRQSGVERAIKECWPEDTVRRDMLVLLMRDLVMRDVQGAIGELGVYKGESARLIHHYLPDRTLHLFDTFEGFTSEDAEAESLTTQAYVRSGQFGDTSVESVRQRIAPCRDTVIFHPGPFPETCDEAVRQERFALVHLDADLYRPILAGLRFFYPRVVPGGYVAIHDYNAWQGARRATNEFFADKPEIPVPMPDKSGTAVVTRAGTD